MWKKRKVGLNHTIGYFILKKSMSFKKRKENHSVLEIDIHFTIKYRFRNKSETGDT